jgi:hypothetical protein
VEELRRPPRRVVAGEHPDLVAEVDERLRLVLGVFDDAAPVGPREGDDDADLDTEA